MIHLRHESMKTKAELMEQLIQDVNESLVHVHERPPADALLKGLSVIFLKTDPWGKEWRTDCFIKYDWDLGIMVQKFKRLNVIKTKRYEIMDDAVVYYEEEIKCLTRWSKLKYEMTKFLFEKRQAKKISQYLTEHF